MRPLSCFLLLASLAFGAKQPTLNSVLLTEIEDGPPLTAAHAFRPGETVYLSFQIGDYTVSDKDTIQLQYRLTATDSAGLALAAPKSDKLAVELSPEDKKWQPKLRWTVPLPQTINPGIYRVQIAIEDELGKGKVAKEVPFRVSGTRVEPSATLAVRNLSLRRQEDDPEPLATPAYRPGDTVWLRFAIVGFQMKEKRPQVEYTVVLRNADGKDLITAPATVAAVDESFYPPQFLPIYFSLTLGKDVPRGVYTVGLEVRDLLGGQTVSAAPTFQVE